MKTLILMFVAAMLAACSSQPRTLVSQDMDDAVVGEKPEGYPKTAIRPLPDQPGFCVGVTEDWIQQEYEGQTVWLKQKTVESVSCTKERWRRLSM